MKKVNGMTVYEPEDPCALDEYSEQLEKDLTAKFDKIEDENEQESTDILTLQNKVTNLEKETEEQQGQITELQNKVNVLEDQIPTGQASGNPIYINDSTNLEAKLKLNGGDKQEYYLPEDYTQLEYIESAGGQYIDTQYKANQKTEYEVEFSYSSMANSSNGFVLGSRISSNQQNLSLTCDSGDIFVGRGNDYEQITVTTNINQKYKMKVTENNIIRDGIVISNAINNFGDETGTYNVRLFNCNQNGSFFRNFTGKIYSCRIWDNGELVREFIPCKRNSDSVLGLYDTVNNVFYTNAGSGSFTAGPEQKVSPDYIAPIETVGSNINLFDKDLTPEQYYYDNNGNKVEDSASLRYFINQDINITKKQYNMGSVEINVRNKNWFVPTLYSNNTKIKQTNAVVTLEKDTFIFECIDGDMYFGDIVSKGSKYTENIGNLIPIYDTSILSVKVINEKFAKNFLTCFDENLISLGYKQFNSSNILNNYSLPEGTKYVTLRFGMSPSMATIGETYKTQVQIEAGELTEYEKYQSQTKIMPIQQEMLEDDYIEDVEHHGWNKLLATGNENWNKSTSYSSENYTMFFLNITGAKYRGQVKCNMFKYQQSFTEDGTFISSAGNSINIKVENSIIGGNTVELFKTFLQNKYNAGTPLIAYYQLSTPIDLELTEEQKEAQKINTYKNITNIAVDNSLATLDVTYKKDQNTVNKNYENRIAALEAAILS